MKIMDLMSDGRLYGFLLIAILAAAAPSCQTADNGDSGDNGGNGDNGGSGAFGAVDIMGLTAEYGGEVTTDGGTTAEKVHKIAGTFEYSEAQDFNGEVVLEINGEERQLSVFNDGYHNDGEADDEVYAFEGDLVVKTGLNTFVVRIIDSDDETIAQSEEMEVTATVPIMAVRAELVWDTNYDDIDLHMFSANDDYHTYYDAQNEEESSYAIPGSFLDIDDVDGYGPEVFTQETACEGEYRLCVNYYANHGGPAEAEVTVYLTLNEGSVQTFTHTFNAETDAMSSSDCGGIGGYGWNVKTFTVPGASLDCVWDYDSGT
ncbi:MAG: hypothetical protein V1911_02540 [Candidatus Micrarchaeota archaeon]